MDPEVEDFLEHFGVKGMKWGVRKERKAAERAAMTPEQKRAQTVKKKARKKIAVNTAIFVGIPASRIATRYFLNKALSKPLSVRQAEQTTKDRKNAIKFFEKQMSMNGQMKIAKLSDAAKKAAIDTTISGTKPGPKALTKGLLQLTR